MPAPYLVCYSASVDRIYTHSPTHWNFHQWCCSVQRDLGGMSGISKYLQTHTDQHIPANFLSLDLRLSLSAPASVDDSSFWITQIVPLLFLVSFMGLGAETPSFFSSFSCLMLFYTHKIPLSVSLSLLHKWLFFFIQIFVMVTFASFPELLVVFSKVSITITIDHSLG